MIAVYVAMVVSSSGAGWLKKRYTKGVGHENMMGEESKLRYYSGKEEWK